MLQLRVGFARIGGLYMGFSVYWWRTGRSIQVQLCGSLYIETVFGDGIHKGSTCINGRETHLACDVEVERHSCAVGKRGPVSMGMGMVNESVTRVYMCISGVIRRTRHIYGGLIPLAFQDS